MSKGKIKIGGVVYEVNDVRFGTYNPATGNATNGDFPAEPVKARPVPKPDPNITIETEDQHVARMLSEGLESLKNNPNPSTAYSSPKRGGKKSNLDEWKEWAERITTDAAMHGELIDLLYGKRPPVDPHPTYKMKDDPFLHQRGDDTPIREKVSPKYGKGFSVKFDFDLGGLGKDYDEQLKAAIHEVSNHAFDDILRGGDADNVYAHSFHAWESVGREHENLRGRCYVNPVYERRDYNAHNPAPIGFRGEIQIKPVSILPGEAIKGMPVPFPAVETRPFPDLSGQGETVLDFTGQ